MLDGREAVIFLVKVRVSTSVPTVFMLTYFIFKVKEYIEDPRKMLLG